MTLGKLANHSANAPAVAQLIIRKRGTRPAEASTHSELMAAFDGHVSSCRAALAELTDAQLAANIPVTFTLQRPLGTVLRSRGLMNHLIHHRGQLSVYLRLLDVPVPGMYGASADQH